MTIKKFILTLAVVTVALSTFASDLVPVSAPILAVELSGSEQVPVPEAATQTRVSAVELPPLQPVADQSLIADSKPVNNEPSGETTFSEPESREAAKTENLANVNEVPATEFAAASAFTPSGAEQLHASDNTRLPVESKLTQSTAFTPVTLMARRVNAPSFVETLAGFFDSLVADVKTLVPTERRELSSERIPETVAIKPVKPVVEAVKLSSATSVFVPFAEYFASISEDVAVSSETERTVASNETAFANEIASNTTDSAAETLLTGSAITENAAQFESEIASANNEDRLSLSNESAAGENAASQLIDSQSAGADVVSRASATSDVASAMESDVASAASEANNSLNISYASLLTPEAELGSVTADHRTDAMLVKPETTAVAVAQPSAVLSSMFEAFMPALSADHRNGLRIDAPMETFSAASTPMFDTFVPSLAADDRSNLRIDAPVETKTIAAVEKQSPVLISNNAELSVAQIPRFAIEPLPVAESFADTISSFNRGPNSEATLVTEALPKTATDAKKEPVMIGGRTMFSSDLLKPMNSATAKPAQVFQGYCDATFVGPPIRFSQTVELKLEDLLSQLHTRFGVNFIMGPNIGKLPLNVKAGAIPWNVLLRSQLFISGVRAKCIDANTIELVENTLLPSLQDGAPVTSRFVKLKFLQRTSGGTVDLANRNQGGQNGGQGGCGGSGGGGQSGGGQSGGGAGGGGGGSQSGQTAAQQGSSRFDQLIVEIEKILGLRSMTSSGSGGGGAGSTTEERRSNRSVTQIPGRNILVIKATEEEHALIDQVIARADRAPFQVVIKGLVYTANETKLRDIGVQTTITGGNASGNPNGGIFGHTAGDPGGTLFDFSAILGTFDFNVQATALQKNGVIVIKSRPFSTVLDGLCTRLDVGLSLPVVINATLGGEGSITFVNAANNLSVTPYVIDDENGNPMAVTLELSLTANTVDSSIVTTGVPAISQRSIQTQLLLGEDKTAILGGFTVDQDRKDISKTPLLGDIPIIGELFKRRIRDTQLNRLYFAISVSVIPFPDAIMPVSVPGATTQPPTISPEMKKRMDEGEPKQYDPNKPADPKKKKDNDNR